eukprot:comp22785_c0_seq1/m.35675 comp22785_c0_seq1/g.35675  ORF comp22785_c0_seq1/g.35675 comp22785_c0_seq1/m.35675 type:complete len:328 (-) comp22785_c0_seq1:374-1357(-)
MTSTKEFELKNSPTDTISSLSFTPDTTNHLLATSWDKNAYVYDANANARRATFNFKAAVLTGCTVDSTRGAAAGLDTEVQWLDFATQEMSKLGEHDEAVSSIIYCKALETIVSGSWDKTIKLWDPRSPGKMFRSMTQPGKVRCMSIAGCQLVVALEDRQVYVWDLRQPDAPSQRRESPLKYMTRSIQCFVDEQGYALGSVEGRVAVEFLNPDKEVQKKRYAFKCHRLKEGNDDVIYPVNTISFNRKYGTFATGGADGIVNIWDAYNKKRLCQLHRYQASVSAASFSHEGELLAIGVSDDGQDGLDRNDVPPPAIYIRNVQESEVKPK